MGSDTVTTKPARKRGVAAAVAAVLGTTNVQPLTGEKLVWKDDKGVEHAAITPADIRDEAYSIFKAGAANKGPILALRKKLADLEADSGNRLMALAKTCIARCNMNVAEGLNVFEAACHYAETKAKADEKAKGTEKPNLRDMLPSWSTTKSAIVTFLTADSSKGRKAGNLFEKIPVIDEKTGKAVLSDTDAYQTISAVRKYNQKQRTPDTRNSASKVLPGLAQTNPKRTAIFKSLTEQLNLITDDNDGNSKADAILFKAVEQLAALTEAGQRHLDNQAAITGHKLADIAKHDAKMAGKAPQSAAAESGVSEEGATEGRAVAMRGGSR